MNVLRGRGGVVIPITELEVFYPLLCATLDAIQVSQEHADWAEAEVAL